MDLDRSTWSLAGALRLGLAWPALGVTAAGILALGTGGPFLRAGLAALAVLAGLGSCALLVLAGRQAAGGMGEAAAAAADVAAGRFARRLALDGFAETRRLAAAINLVAETISLHDEQLNAALEEAARQRDRFYSIINAASDGLLLYDAEGRIITANTRCTELLGLSRQMLEEDVSLLQLEVQSRCDEPEAYRERLQAHFAHPDAPHQDRLVLVRPRRRVLRRYSSPVFDHGTPAGRVFTYTDITPEVDLDQMKSEFVSMASHELRTPLTSVHGALQLALSGAADQMAEEDRELLEISLESTNRLVRLVNALLDLSKIEAGRMPFDRVPLDMARLVGEALRGMQGLAGPREILLVNACPDSLPLVEGDRDHLQRVLANLLSNAIKYSPPASCVAVSAREEDGTIEIEVRDEGPGIPPDQIDRLFKPFCRLGAQERQATGGSGLGLAISRAIVEQHGGRISAEPASPRGSRFLVRLPRMSARADGTGRAA